MDRAQYILFDFDGTIVDTGEGITKGVAYALRQLGAKEETQQTLRKFVGPPLKESFMVLCGLDEAQTEEAIRQYRVYYQQQGLLESVPYDGIGELLRALRAEHKIVALATSKPRAFAQSILESFGLVECFDYIAGSNMDGTHNDKAEVIAEVLEHYGITGAGNTVMVGDRKYDVIGARTMGLPCIGVLYGFGDRAEMEEVCADEIAGTVEELKELLLTKQEVLAR